MLSTEKFCFKALRSNEAAKKAARAMYERTDTNQEAPRPRGMAFALFFISPLSSTPPINPVTPGNKMAKAY
jgi:hypothetical protein